MGGSTIVKLARGQDGGHAAQEPLVDHLRLGHVGDLGRAADVRGGGQKRVLDDRAEQSAGRELLGRRSQSRRRAAVR